MMEAALKRLASGSLGGMLGGGATPAQTPRGAGEPSGSGRDSDEEESANSEKTATTNLISAGHESFELIFMMLMGIRTCVGRFSGQAAPKELTPEHFNFKWEGDFLARGSAETPAHGHHDFRFKDYSPLVFRQIRERFGIETPDYMLSLTSEYVLVEMFTNSKSGSFFFYSADFRFILKTCTKREAAFLMSALPQYHQHLMQNRYTLLSRIFGLHRVQMRSGKRVFFVVMGNVFPIDRPVHERYDLKGSTRNRFTTDEERQDPNVVLKDLDWINSGRKLHLGADKKRRLLAQIKKDCALLERLEVIDYSMLVGIHRTAATRGGDSGGKGDRSSAYIKVGSGGKSSCGCGGASASGGGGGGGGGGAGGSGGSEVGGGGDGGAPSEVGSLAGAMREAAVQHEAAVHILDTVTHQQLRDEHQRREKPPATPRGGGGGGGGPEDTIPSGEIYFVGLIDILCECVRGACTLHPSVCCTPQRAPHRPARSLALQVWPQEAAGAPLQGRQARRARRQPKLLGGGPVAVLDPLPELRSRRAGLTPRGRSPACTYYSRGVHL